MKKHIAILLLTFYTLLLGVFELKVFSSGTLLAAHAGFAIPSEEAEDTRDNVCLYNFHEKNTVARVDVCKPVTVNNTLFTSVIAGNDNYAKKTFRNLQATAVKTSLIRNLCCVYRI